MAQKGKAGEAVGIAITASALGGLFGGVCLIFFSPILAEMALKLGPPEYFALTLLGLVSITVISRESTTKGLMVGTVGLLISTIGMDEFSGAYRFTFDAPPMLGGFHLVAIVVGLFALPEMFVEIKANGLNDRPKVKLTRVSWRAFLSTVRSWLNLIRSSLIGTFFGALPGAGGLIAAFSAYAVARAVSSTPETFGTGNPDGVVATESANNACCGGTLIPSLALAVPGDAASAVLIGALILVGYFPGPDLFENHVDVVGGIFLAYMWANISLFFLGMLFTPLFASVLKIKKKHLIPVISLLSVIDVYAIQNSVFDLWVMLGFGIAGYFLRVFNYPLAPLVIGVVLGGICESNFRRSLVFSMGDLGIFIDRPISASILAVCLIAVVVSVIPIRSILGAYLGKPKR